MTNREYLNLSRMSQNETYNGALSLIYVVFVSIWRNVILCAPMPIANYVAKCDINRKESAALNVYPLDSGVFRSLGSMLYRYDM